MKALPGQEGGTEKAQRHKGTLYEETDWRWTWNAEHSQGQHHDQM